LQELLMQVLSRYGSDLASISGAASAQGGDAGGIAALLSKLSQGGLPNQMQNQQNFKGGFNNRNQQFKKQGG